MIFESLNFFRKPLSLRLCVLLGLRFNLLRVLDLYFRRNLQIFTCKSFHDTDIAFILVSQFLPILMYLYFHRNFLFLNESYFWFKDYLIFIRSRFFSNVNRFHIQTLEFLLNFTFHWIKFLFFFSSRIFVRFRMYINVLTTYHILWLCDCNVRRFCFVQNF